MDHISIEHGSTIAVPTIANHLSNRFSLSTVSTIVLGAYPYTQDLLRLHNSGKRSHSPDRAHIPGITDIISPLQPVVWARALQNHPDEQLCEYILRGLQFGFHISFAHSQPLSSARVNMPSAAANPQPVDEYLSKERAAHRVIGPLTPSMVDQIHVNRFGVIPKRHQPVNDDIDRDSCSLQYTTVDDAARLISQLGQGTLMAKIHIVHAYRNVPVYPADWKLLGMSWRGSIFVDGALPFGLRSAPTALYQTHWSGFFSRKASLAVYITLMIS